MSALNDSSIFAKLGTGTITQTNDRIFKLKEKISGIESTIEIEKAKQMERLNSHIEAIDEQLKSTIDERNNTIGSMSSKLNNLEEYLEESASERDLMFENSLRQLKLFEQKMNGIIDQEAGNQKEQAKLFLAVADEKLNEVDTELTNETTKREEDIGCLKTSLENDIPKIQDEINNAAAERTEMIETYAKKIADDIKNVNVKIMEEKKQSEDISEALLETLKEMVTRIKGEIEDEKKQREASENAILSLLEETCSKFNISSKPSQSIRVTFGKLVSI